MQVYLKDGSAQTSLRATTLRYKLQVNFLPHSVTVHWHRADQSQCWPHNDRRLAGKPLECQCLSHWCDSTWKNPVSNGIRTPGLPLSRRTPYPLSQRDGRLGERVLSFMQVNFTWGRFCNLPRFLALLTSVKHASGVHAGRNILKSTSYYREPVAESKKKRTWSKLADRRHRRDWYAYFFLPWCIVFKCSSWLVTLSKRESEREREREREREHLFVI